MPQIELLPVPTDIQNYRAYLLNNFRRVADAIARVVPKSGPDDIEITDFDRGIILTSPDGSRFRITVDNTGTLQTTLI